MSFTKRYLNEENIKSNVDNLMNYLGNADAIFITDKFSEKVYHMFINDISEEEIIKYIETNGE